MSCPCTPCLARWEHPVRIHWNAPGKFRGCGGAGRRDLLEVTWLTGGRAGTGNHSLPSWHFPDTHRRVPGLVEEPVRARSKGAGWCILAGRQDSTKKQLLEQQWFREQGGRLGPQRCLGRSGEKGVEPNQPWGVACAGKNLIETNSVARIQNNPLGGV